MTPRPSRLPPLALVAGLVALLAGAFAVAPRPAAAEKVHTKEALNYTWTIRDTWEWLEPSRFSKHAVVDGADRLLKVLRRKGADGKPLEATGQGLRALLSVQDPPKSLEADYETWLRDYDVFVKRTEAAKDPATGEEPKDLATLRDDLRVKVDAALAALGALPEVQGLLMSRWGDDPKKWPKPEISAENESLGGVPAVKITAEGECLNLLGNPNPCQAWMLVAVVKNKMFRLAAWKWPSERDAEGLKGEWNGVDLGFEILDKTPTPRKGEPPPPDVKSPDAPVGDSAEKKAFEDKVYLLKGVKPLKFASFPPDRTKEAEKSMVFRFRAHASSGEDAYVDCMAYKVSGGVTAFSVDEHMIGLWAGFVKEHTALETMPYPPISEKTPFLSLPDASKKKPVKSPEEGDTTSRSELERMGVVSDAKGAKVKDAKARFPWRVALSGLSTKYGRETQFQWIFSTPTHTYVVRYVLYKDAFAMYAPELAEILSSIAVEEK